MGIRWALFLVAFLGFATAGQARQPIELIAPDGVTIYGERHAPMRQPIATVLLFHQAASNRAEFAPVVPRLVKAGYNVIAIDQRAGGHRFDATNETVRKLGRSGDYLDALPDLETALAYARRANPGVPVILWGSSYSASLSLVLAANHPADVAGVVAFSPGDYFGLKLRVAEAAAKVSVPVFVTSDATSGEITQAKAVVDAAPSQMKAQFVPEYGRHGVSILNPELNPKGAEAAWGAVETFLDTLNRRLSYRAG